MAKIQKFGWTLVDHPPYIPDLSPSDYYLFRNMKMELKKYFFNDIDELETEVIHYFDSKPTEWYFRGISMYKDQLTNCIQNKGDY